MLREKMIATAAVGVVALWGGIAHADGGAANSEEFLHGYPGSRNWAG
jgi:hypothetical protein